MIPLKSQQLLHGKVLKGNSSIEVLNNVKEMRAFNPSPPGLPTGAPSSAWGGAYHGPAKSQSPLAVESRARRHSKAFHMTHSNHLSKLNIEVTCEIKVRSKVKSGVFTFWALGAGIIDYHDSNSGTMLSYAWLRYARI